MPKVTLQKDEYSSYSFAFGMTMFSFAGGRPKEVPVPVALELAKKKDEKGNPLFVVSDMPKIVAPSHAKEEKQNVAGKTPYQRRIEECLGAT